VQIQQQTSLQSAADTESASLQQAQTYFTSTGTDIASALSSFSSSLAALSANSTSSSAQQGVLAAGQNLASAFNTAARPDRRADGSEPADTRHGVANQLAHPADCAAEWTTGAGAAGEGAAPCKTSSTRL